MDSKKSSSSSSFFSYLIQTYLFLYNAFMFLIHGVIFAAVGEEVIHKHFSYMNHYPLMMFATSLQLLDIVHSFLGLTRTGIAAGLIQVFGRLFILWLAHFVEIDEHHFVTEVLCIAYMAIELFRYPYYCARVVNSEVSILTWFRYNAWLICYPVGLTCEFFTMRNAFASHSLTTMYTKNIHNEILRDAAFKWALQVFTMYLLFPYIAFTLLSHMWHQRTKKNAETSRKVKTN